MLADLAAYLGMRYNLGVNQPRISLYIDEVSNVINTPAIEIMNKGAEAGCQVTVAMQTFADLVSRLGSEHAARMALGNLNNLIAFALRIARRRSTSPKRSGSFRFTSLISRLLPTPMSMFPTFPPATRGGLSEAM